MIIDYSKCGFQACSGKCKGSCMTVVVYTAGSGYRRIHGVARQASLVATIVEVCAMYLFTMCVVYAVYVAALRYCYTASTSNFLLFIAHYGYHRMTLLV